jgi:hypothetical protein
MKGRKESGGHLGGEGLCGFSHFYSQNKRVEQKSPAQVGYNRQRERKTKQASYCIRVLGHALWSLLAQTLQGGESTVETLGCLRLSLVYLHFWGHLVESTIEIFLA